MKLIHKTILYYLLVSIPLLLLAGIISFGQIRDTVRESNDELMFEQKNDAEKGIQAMGPADLMVKWDFNNETTIEIDSTNGTGYRYSDIYKMDEDAEQVNYRILKSYYKHKGKNYKITVIKPTIEEDDLIESLTGVLLIIISGLVLAFFLVNWLVSKTLWKPFYKTIDTLNNYELRNYSGQGFEPSNIKEFVQLNETLNKMTAKMYSDFVHQKEFTENASHEMQTPLAVIKAKIDLLMQSPNLKEQDMNQLQGIDNSVSKLASLNKALLLLAKIENHQFKDVSEISLTSVIDKVLSNYEDQLQAKNISFKKEIKADLKLKMNAGLADILITNFIQNAIRHNIIDGVMHISISNNSLIISNTGSPLNIKPDELFIRFKKNDASKESLGLGLSIVKGIADAYRFRINYSYSGNFHTFTLSTDLL